VYALSLTLPRGVTAPLAGPAAARVRPDAADLDRLVQGAERAVATVAAPAVLATRIVGPSVAVFSLQSEGRCARRSPGAAAV
jgi:hypothetical protein